DDELTGRDLHRNLAHDGSRAELDGGPAELELRAHVETRASAARGSSSRYTRDRNTVRHPRCSRIGAEVASRAWGITSGQPTAPSARSGASISARYTPLPRNRCSTLPPIR